MLGERLGDPARHCALPLRHAASRCGSLGERTVCLWRYVQGLPQLVKERRRHRRDRRLREDALGRFTRGIQHECAERLPAEPSSMADATSAVRLRTQLDPLGSGMG